MLPISITIVYILWSLSSLCAADSFVCSTDASFGTRSNDKVTENRLKALEEKVLELQKLLQHNNFMSNDTTVPDIPIENLLRGRAMGHGSSEEASNKENYCEELYNNGTQVDGIYSISPDGRCPFFVYCDMTNGGWTLIQRRSGSEVSFARSWEEYVEGFGELEGSHWLGLNKIHRLTKVGSQIYFDMDMWSGKKEFAHYKDFVVHESTTSFKMNVDKFGYNGSVDESFSYHDDKKFSTFDRDNDGYYSSCSETHGGGGWWYTKDSNCQYTGNMNGIYGNKRTGGLNFGSGEPIKTMNIKVKALKGTC